jgi:hypothetical protein
MRRREFLGIVTRGAMSAALLPSADGLFRFAQDAGNSGSAVRLNQAGYLPERKKNRHRSFAGHQLRAALGRG